MMKRFGGQRIRTYLAVLSMILYIFTKISVSDQQLLSKESLLTSIKQKKKLNNLCLVDDTILFVTGKSLFGSTLYPTSITMEFILEYFCFVGVDLCLHHR